MALSKLHNARLTFPVFVDKLHHPIDFALPFWEIGKKNPTKRSFQASWFKQWKWIHCNEENNSVYCFYCVKAYKENKLNNIPNLQKTYILTGFTNWKDATSRFTSHEATRCHQDAMLKIVTLPATACDIEAIDLIGNCINDRFDQPRYKIYQHVQNLLLQVVNSEEYKSSLSFVTHWTLMLTSWKLNFMCCPLCSVMQKMHQYSCLT